MEWENLPSDDPARESFQAGLLKCEPKIVEFGHNQISLLNDLIKYKWSEPTLIKIMVGDEEIDEAEGRCRDLACLGFERGMARSQNGKKS
jgi:hypothetical protein